MSSLFSFALSLGFCVSVCGFFGSGLGFRLEGLEGDLNVDS